MRCSGLDKEIVMINLYLKGQDQPAGTISEAQLQFLIDELEEETLEDQDYAITSMLLQVFEADGADPALLTLLKSLLGDKQEIEVRWRRA
jgi:processive 1,2-diacylglycerol beta-glucosyltransferase